MGVAPGSCYVAKTAPRTARGRLRIVASIYSRRRRKWRGEAGQPPPLLRPTREIHEVTRWLSIVHLKLSIDHNYRAGDVL